MKGISSLDAFGVGDNDSMAGVVAACTARTDVGVRSKDVDELALPLVSPLGSEDDSHCIGVVR